MNEQRIDEVLIDPKETPEPFELHPKWGAVDAIDAAQIVLSNIAAATV